MTHTGGFVTFLLLKHCDLDNLQKESVFGITDLDDLVHGGGAEAAGDRHGNWTRNWGHMS